MRASSDCRVGAISAEQFLVRAIPTLGHDFIDDSGPTRVGELFELHQPTKVFGIERNHELLLSLLGLGGRCLNHVLWGDDLPVTPVTPGPRLKLMQLCAVLPCS